MVYAIVVLVASIVALSLLALIVWHMHSNSMPKTPTENLVATLMARLNQSEKARRQLSMKLKKIERENERLCAEKLHAWDIPDKV